MREYVWDEYKERYSSNELFEKILYDYYLVIERYGLDFAIQS